MVNGDGAHDESSDEWHIMTAFIWFFGDVGFTLTS